MSNIATTMYRSNIKGLPLLSQGKVRDIYEIDASNILLVTTDRLSAFDVILPDPIPEKGRVLTALSNFWFNKTKHIINNHLSDKTLQQIIIDKNERDMLEGRSVVAHKLDPLPVEAIVRGYLTGSAWSDYLKQGTVSGISLPSGMQHAQQLPQVIFTPSTKAQLGSHDENITFQTMIDLLGHDIAEQLRDVSIRLYQEAAAYALNRGIIIADTKFEFGTDKHNQLILIDEIMTPDSSRFWPADKYQPNTIPPSFDKQYIRDYLETLDWDKTDPAPHLPDTVIQKTRDKYLEAQQRLMGGLHNNLLK